MKEALRIRASDGIQIVVHVWAVAAPRAVMQIAHGAAEHAARYAWFAGKMNQRGITVYANDHRGHGETASDGELGYMGEPNGWNRLVEDAAELTQLIAERHPRLPRIVLGHSMGSLLVQQFLKKYGDRVDLAILSAPTNSEGSGALRPLLAQELADKGRLGISDVMSRMSTHLNSNVPDPRTPSDWLSRDHEQVDRYMADPLCGFPLRLGSVIDMLDAMDDTAQAGKPAAIPVNLPIYVMAGEMDPVHESQKNLGVLISGLRDAGVKDTVLKVYPGARHELLNETNREQVVNDLLDWIDARLPGSM